MMQLDSIYLSYIVYTNYAKVYYAGHLIGRMYYSPKLVGWSFKPIKGSPYYVPAFVELEYVGFVGLTSCFQAICSCYHDKG